MAISFSADPPKPKQQSRSDRWSAAIGKAREGIEQLKELQEEYQEWFDSMPENLQSGPTGEKLEEISNLDLDGAMDVLEDAEGLELPKGFGRD